MPRLVGIGGPRSCVVFAGTCTEISLKATNGSDGVAPKGGPDAASGVTGTADGVGGPLSYATVYYCGERYRTEDICGLLPKASRSDAPSS